MMDGLLGAQLKEFCPYGVKEECRKFSHGTPCSKLHFRKIIQKHTDGESNADANHRQEREYRSSSGLRASFCF